MGILKTIFGSGDVISKGLELIDDMHTSDVEMVEARTKAKTDLLAAYAPFKIAQRYLALMFGGSYVISFWLCIVLVFFSNNDLQWSIIFVNCSCVKLFNVNDLD